MNRVSVVISSYNQKTRLKHCLDSACAMKTDFADDIEIIVADDHSTDGSIELIEQYPVKLSLCDVDNKSKYTLTRNWNHAVKTHVTGERVLFTNGDHVLTPRFADHHADPVFENNIIFGPGYQTRPQVVDHLHLDYKQLMTVCEQQGLLLPDRHVEGSAMTYNEQWTSDFPYGYNFSITTEHFNDVGGFTEKESWGDEERLLCDKVLNMYPDVKILSNRNSVVIHLYHTPHNLMNRHTGALSEYAF